MRGDVRSRSIAITSDRIVNAEPGSPLAAVLDLVLGTWGIAQLPPARLPDRAASAWLANLAEQLAEYDRHGFRLARLVAGPDDDRHLAALDGALGAVGVPVPPLVVVGAAAPHEVLGRLDG